MEEAGGRGRVRDGDMTMKAEVRMIQLLALNMEGAMTLGMQASSRSWKR